MHRRFRVTPNSEKGVEQPTVEMIEHEINININIIPTCSFSSRSTIKTLHNCLGGNTHLARCVSLVVWLLPFTFIFQWMEPHLQQLEESSCSKPIWPMLFTSIHQCKWTLPPQKTAIRRFGGPEPLRFCWTKKTYGSPCSTIHMTTNDYRTLNTLDLFHLIDTNGACCCPPRTVHISDRPALHTKLAELQLSVKTHCKHCMYGIVAYIDPIYDP